jgi:hypothetical protein
VSKNKPTIDHLKLACRPDELRNAGAFMHLEEKPAPTKGKSKSKA